MMKNTANLPVIMFLLFSASCVSKADPDRIKIDSELVHRFDVLTKQIGSDDLVRYFSESAKWWVRPESQGEYRIFRRNYFRKRVIGEHQFSMMPPPFKVRWVSAINQDVAVFIRINEKAEKTKRVSSDHVEISWKNGVWQSEFQFDNEALSMTVAEKSESRARILTQQALAEINNELSTFIKYVKNESMTDRVLLEDTSMIYDRNPYLYIDKGYLFDFSFDTNRVTVLGYVNPGKAGYVYLEIIDQATGKELSDPVGKTRMSEVTGWSSDPCRKFYFDITADVEMNVVEVGTPISFDIWFQPRNGKEKTLLVTETIVR